MHPAGAARQAIVNDPAMHHAFGVARPRRAERVEIRVIEEIGGLLEEGDLIGTFRPPHFVHHFGAVDELCPR